MYIMTQIPIYQHSDGTLGIGQTNDLRNWFMTTRSLFRPIGEIRLVAVFPIAWAEQSTFLAKISKKLENKLVIKKIPYNNEAGESSRKAYQISVDDLYKVFSNTIEDMGTDTYMPSAMLEEPKNSIPPYQIWNFDYFNGSMFEIRQEAN